jgi:hypothetical protein
VAAAEAGQRAGGGERRGGRGRLAPSGSRSRVDLEREGKCAAGVGVVGAGGRPSEGQGDLWPPIGFVLSFFI